MKDQFTDWDRHNPYPKTTEGKATYETAMQAWWERNGFNGRASATDLIPLTPGTSPVDTRECFACGRNDRNDPCFPHRSDECLITPKVPKQEAQWRGSANYRARIAAAATQPNQASIQQIGEYETYQGHTKLTGHNQGNGEEPTALRTDSQVPTTRPRHNPWTHRRTGDRKEKQATHR